MNKEVSSFVNDYKEHVEKQYDFVEASLWFNEPSRDKRKSRHDTIYKVIKSNLERLKYLISIADEKDRKYKVTEKFIELIVKLIKMYVDQSKKYLNDEDWSIYSSTIEDESQVEKHQNEEIDFQNSILENINKLNVEVSKLNLEDLVKEIVIPIYGNKLAPFLMRGIFINRYPKITQFLEQNGLKDVFKY